MKKFYLLVIISFFCVNLRAQNFSDPNFSYTIVSDGWVQALGAAFSKDAQRLFVWEKAGFVYVCNKSGNTYARQATPVINFSAEVLNWMDQGLLGFALDPEFLTNGYIYLLYSVDRRFLMNDNSIAADAGFAATIGRVTRYKTILSGSNLVADLTTRTILLGETKTTGIPLIHESHGIGSLAFAADGTLLVSAGEAANFNGEDAGSDNDTYYVQALADGIIRPQENVGAFRSQLLNSHSGKLLRIDPATGNGVASNPFYSAAEPRSPKSRVWALGFRNPFRFIIRPGSGSTNPAAGDIGEVYVGDVGWETWEDFNIVSRPGQNFGWPVYEGQTVNTRYATYAATTQNGDEPNPLAGGGCSRPFFTFRELLKDPTADGNATIYNPCNASLAIGTGNRYVHRRPALDYAHNQNSSRVGIFSGNNPAIAEIGTPASGVAGTPFAGNCVVAGMWYTGNDFPAVYKDKFFLADWGGLWIKRISVDFTDVVTRVDNFASNFEYVVSMVENPVDGTVVVVNMGFPPVGILDYGGNQPPVAKPVSNVTFGSSPLTVNFTGNTSFDPSPGGSIVSYSWNFGGGVPATSTVANPGNVVFTDATGNPKKFVAKLTVTDNGGASHTDSVIISVNNTPPVVNITSPINNSTYKPGSDTTYSCTAIVTDNQHGAAQLKYEWQTFLRHNTHEHAGVIDNNVNTTTRISRIGCNGDSYSWFIKLKVTDAAGLFGIDSAKLFPDCIVGPDITPPTVSSVSPLNLATGISISTAITATFNEAVNSATITGTTFQLKDAGNNVIPASVNTASNQITLTPGGPLTNSTTYTVTIKGGATGVKDLAGNALVNDYIWTFTTAAADNTPPTVISVSPLAGATAVGISTTVTANFSEVVNAATVTGATFQLKDAGNNIVSASVNTTSDQITLTPTNALTTSTIYTVTIIGGASGVKDLAGNALVVDYSWSFTTVALGTTTNLFPTAIPDSRSNDGQGIALGVKFRSTQNGFVTGVRYYKPLGTTGTHIGHLWTSTGTMLAQATFINETASGWQQVLFTTPVAITAGITYVASYHSPSGDFAASGAYFTQAVINGPLRGLANGEDGVNGLYKYSATAVFPNNGYNASNYWADVVFSTGSGGDVTPPTVTTVSPLNGATGVSINTTVTANFSEAVNAATVTGTTFQLKAGSTVIPATVGTASNQITLTPSAALTNSTTYTVTIKGGATGVKDLAGNALVNDFTWTFTTGASVDNTPPTVTTVSPLNGATGVSIATTVTANFSEAINGTTVTVTTFELKAGSTVIPAIVNTVSNQITLTPTAALTNSTTYTVTIKGGVTGVKDLAGNALVNDFTWTFTTIAGGGGGSTTTIFQPTTVPANPTNNDGQGIVLGVRFRSTQNGSITGIRYYKGAGTTGTHIGSLWSNTGTLLATATFTGETASGWQQVLFASPVAITAGVTYVASQFSPSGHYASTVSYFTQAVVNGALRGLANGEDGLNGLYKYSATSTFPTFSHLSSNYWVDVVFTTGGTAIPTVTTHPSSQTVCVGNNVSFISAANGGTPTVQWQSSTNGTSWTNITGATTSTLTFAATAVDNNKQYRAVWTNSGGPVNSNAATLTVNPIPGAPTVNVVNNCGSSVLTASGFTGSLLWSTGASTASITVATGGVYTVTQTVNGCTSPAGSGTAAPLNSAVAAPAVNVVNNCGNSVLTASGFTGSLLWSTGATTTSITVATGGVYTVTQTVNGCTSPAGSGTASPKSTPAAPSVAVVNNCESSVLTASGFTGSLLWSNTATTPSITVTTGGTHTVTQTIDGCTSATGTGVAAPKPIPSAPAVSVANNCGSSVLTASGFTGSLSWSTGATTASITVATGGVYTVTQTVSGCTSPAGSGTAAPLNSAVAAPTINVVNNCGNSVLTASGFTGSLLWSTGATTASITVPTGGVYTVTQTVDGCTSPAGSGTAAPKATPAAPSVAVVNNCESSVLTASGFTGSLLWSNTATTPSITVTTGGTSTVTQTIDGCTSAAGTGVAAPKPIPSAPAVSVVNNCGSSVLTASGFTGSLLWSTGATTASITVATGGVYTVTQTVNGCTSAGGTGTAEPITSVVPTPIVDVVNNCGNSVLTASGFTGSLLWSTGATTASITIATGGVYTVTQTVNGCTSSAASGTAAPKATPAAPSVAVVNNCESSVLTASGFTGSLLWNNTATTPSITVTTGGTYTVTQTINGCTSAAGTGVAAPKPIPSAPTVSVVNNCSNSVLTAGLFTGSLLWSNGATSSFISVTAGGTYGVTQNVNGCTSAAGSGIAQPLNASIPTPTVNVANNCGNSVLTASGFTGSLLWSNGATTTSITVTVPGAYTVSQIINGCSSASGGGVAAPKAIPALSSSLALTATSGTPLAYTPASTIGGTVFTWSRAAVSGISNATATGTGNITETLVNTTSSAVNVTYVYTLTVNGCVNTQNVVVTVNPVSTVNCMINGSITSSFTSTAIPAGRYIWFNSVLDRGSFTGITGTVIFTITNGKITFTANSQQYTLNVPNATLRFDAAVTSASTQFVNNAWQTVVPRGYTNFAFVSGLSYQVPSNLPGNISNVKWTADISINKTGITPSWKWGAAVYTSFAGHAGLNIKPINGNSENPYPNNDKAGTPENFKTSLVSGAKGSGGTNYTGNYSGTSSTTCTTTSGQRSSGALSVTITEDTIESKSNLEVTAIPNPSNTYFTVIINSQKENPVTVKVFDILGQVMERYEKIASNSRLSIGHKWTSGYYFIEVMQDDQRKFLKVVKTN